MMKYCPKCQTFYEDELLRFCLKDGVPLNFVNESTAQWSEGEKFIHQKQKKLQQISRRKKLKRILIMLITMILVVMIISVIALQTWIYTHPTEVEEIRRSQLPTSEPVPTRTVEIAQIPEETPTLSPTIEPTVLPTVKTSPQISPSPTVTITITPPIEKCDAAAKVKIIKLIEKDNIGYFSQSIGNIKIEEAKEFYKKSHDVFRVVKFGVNPANYKMNVQKNDCKDVLVKFEFDMLPDTSQLPPNLKIYRSFLTFVCSKKGEIWRCK